MTVRHELLNATPAQWFRNLLPQHRALPPILLTSRSEMALLPLTHQTVRHQGQATPRNALVFEKGIPGFCQVPPSFKNVPATHWRHAYRNGERVSLEFHTSSRNGKLKN